MWGVAYTYKCADTIMEMYVDDLILFHNGITWINEELDKKE